MKGNKKLLKLVAVLIGITVTVCAFAESITDIGSVAAHVATSFQNIGKLMAATAYLAGFGLTVAAIFKFKQHKDNPAQTPMGIPLTMLVVGITLIFLPGFISPAGTTIFGTQATAGGFTGGGIESIPGGKTTS